MKNRFWRLKLVVLSFQASKMFTSRSSSLRCCTSSLYLASICFQLLLFFWIISPSSVFFSPVLRAGLPVFTDNHKKLHQFMFVKLFLLFCQLLPVPHLRRLLPPRVLLVLELFFLKLSSFSSSSLQPRPPVGGALPSVKQARAGSLPEP